MGRASISKLARRNAWTVRGLATVRWNLASQRRKRGSPARLGANPDRKVVGNEQLGGGVGQDQGAGAFGSGAGEEQRHRAGVEQDQPGERGKGAQEQGDPRILPGQVDVAVVPSGHHQVGGPAPSTW